MNFNYLSTVVYGVAKASKNAVAAISKKLDETVFGELNDLNREFIKDKKLTTELPWRNNEDVKEAILGLSSDKANFTTGPPENVSFDYRPSQFRNLIDLLLRQDPNLGQMEVNLVPREVTGFVFWRNYFYHMSLILQKSSKKPANLELVKVTEGVTTEEKGVQEDINIDDIDINDCEIEYTGENWRDAVEDMLRSETLD
ncbi:Synapse-associated protein 1 [Thelohanellus kitauei]|uniref:Synapse-associated protein 1 n=1 Tax=Thelohanellus kitauei TaxID=669202 RepID=A0A0C2JL72_THEKT|nr:Synapse-associated protein 1 [Thelohanellus kitauei]